MEGFGLSAGASAEKKARTAFAVIDRVALADVIGWLFFVTVVMYT